MTEAAPPSRRWTKPPSKFSWTGVFPYVAGFVSGGLMLAAIAILYAMFGERELHGPIYRTIDRAPELVGVVRAATDPSAPMNDGRRRFAEPRAVRALGFRGSGDGFVVSANGRRVAFTNCEPHDLYTVFAFDAPTKTLDAVATICESDPGSGYAFEYEWTADSKALVISGSGPVYGYRFDEDLLPLVWFVGDDKLCSAR